jgi:hypothetical protein
MTPLRRILVWAAAVSVAACGAIRDYHASNPDFGSSTPPYERIRFASQFATVQERARCEAAGGTVRQAGRLGGQHCVQSFPDAGRTCNGSQNCLGECRLPDDAGELAPGTAVQGVCQADDAPFGCFTAVEDGKAGPTLCVD